MENQTTIKLLCPKCKEIQECNLINILPEKKEVIAECTKCKGIFIEYNLQIKYDETNINNF